MWQVAAYDEEFEAMAWSFRSRDASGRRQQHSILVHVCPHLEAVSRSRLVKEGNRTCRVGKGVDGRWKCRQCCRARRAHAGADAVGDQVEAMWCANSSDVTIRGTGEGLDRRACGQPTGREAWLCLRIAGVPVSTPAYIGRGRRKRMRSGEEVV